MKSREYLESLSLDFRLTCKNLDTIFDKIEKHPKSHEIAKSLIISISDEINRVVGTFDEFSNYQFDVSATAIPSFYNLDINHRENWTNLIRYLIRLIDLTSEDKKLLKSFVLNWMERDFIVFKRLVWFAYQKYDVPVKTDLFYQVKKSPYEWLWSSSPELTKGLQYLWDELTEKQRLTFSKMILKLNSESVIETLEAKYIEDWKSELVQIISQSENGVNDELKMHLPYKNEKFDNKKSDSVKQPIKLLSELSKKEALEKINSINENSNFSELNQLLKDDPEYTTELIHSTKSIPAKEYFLRQLSIASEIEIDSKHFFKLIDNLPPESVEREIYSVTRSVRENSNYYNESPAKYWKVWDKLLDFSLKKEFEPGNDPFTDAINHPIGILIYGIINAMKARSFKVGEGLINSFKDRIKKLTEKKNEPTIYVLSVNYSYLFQVDQNFTKEILTPYFNVDKYNTTAINSWDAFLYHPFIDPDIWESLSSYFLSICKKADKLNRTVSNLAVLITDLSIRKAPLMNYQIANECIREIPDHSFHSLNRLKNYIPSEQININSFWDNDLEPWIENVWPKEINFQKERTTLNFVYIALELGDAFPDYINKISNFLMPLSRGYGIYKKILESESNFVDRFPNEVFLLLRKTIPDYPPEWFARREVIPTLLTRIVNKVGENEETRNLKRKVAQAGL